MARMRVWLNEWEWACCGDPFAVSEPIPGTAALHPAPRVPWPPRYDDPELPDASSIPGFIGFLVDLETE